jgi:hypothetical protein
VSLILNCKNILLNNKNHPILGSKWGGLQNLEQINFYLVDAFEFVIIHFKAT